MVFDLFFLLSASLLAVFAFAASYFDVVFRRIPNKLNFAGFFIAVLLNYVAYSEFPGFFPLYAGFLFSSFIFSLALYFFGVWSAGDSKFFVALLAFLPLFSSFDVFSFLWVFFASVLTVVFWVLLANLSVLNKKGFFVGVKSVFFSSLQGAVFPAFVVFVLSFFNDFVLLAFFFAFSLFVGLPRSFALALLLTAAFLSFDAAVFSFAASFSVIFLFGILFFLRRRLVFLSKDVALKDLKEGMVSAQTLVLKDGRAVQWSLQAEFSRLFKKVEKTGFAGLQGFFPRSVLASSFEAKGLSVAQIKRLKSVKGLKSLRVRQALPFAPFALVGFAVFLFFA
ncbi:MAG: prepilin peptidase [Candidatus Micrarchaeia archaeon]